MIVRSPKKIPGLLVERGTLQLLLAKTGDILLLIITLFVFLSLVLKLAMLLMFPRLFSLFSPLCSLVVFVTLSSHARDMLIFPVISEEIRNSVFKKT